MTNKRKADNTIWMLERSDEINKFDEYDRGNDTKLWTIEWEAIKLTTTKKWRWIFMEYAKEKCDLHFANLNNRRNHSMMNRFASVFISHLIDRHIYACVLTLSNDNTLTIAIAIDRHNYCDNRKLISYLILCMIISALIVIL